jgi:hypothetical protein
MVKGRKYDDANTMSSFHHGGFVILSFHPCTATFHHRTFYYFRRGFGISTFQHFVVSNYVCDAMALTEHRNKKYLLKRVFIYSCNTLLIVTVSLLKVKDHGSTT